MIVRSFQAALGRIPHKGQQVFFQVLLQDKRYKLDLYQLHPGRAEDFQNLNLI